MADVAWSQFTDYVLPLVPSAPKFLAERMAKESCKEFLEFTGALRQDADDITIVADTSEYAITFNSAADEYSPVRLKEIWLGSQEIYETTEDRLANDIPGWSKDEASKPTHAFLTWDYKLRLYPIPTATNTNDITLECEVTVTNDATQVNDIMYKLYAEEISYGAASRILRMPNQMWSDVALAVYYEDAFRRGKARIRAKFNKGRTEKPLSAKWRDTFIIG